VLGRHRSDFSFRGEAVSGQRLLTSLARLGGDYAAVEQHPLRNFRHYARRKAVPEDTVWSCLAVGKHHGLLPRLLDWSHSPYVALHVATVDADVSEQDGVVWMVDYVAAPTAPRLLPERLHALLAGEGSNVFTVGELGEAACALADRDRLADEEVRLFFEPPALDDRIVNQYALFSLMSSPSARLDRWITRSSRGIVIPAGLKPEVRDKLDQANVAERVLFPGLDGLSASLKRYYRPRV
jgi:FRG domain